MDREPVELRERCRERERSAGVVLCRDGGRREREVARIRIGEGVAGGEGQRGSEEQDGEWELAHGLASGRWGAAEQHPAASSKGWRTGERSDAIWAISAGDVKTPGSRTWWCSRIGPGIDPFPRVHRSRGR